jgi:hypothetical protein
MSDASCPPRVESKQRAIRPVDRARVVRFDCGCVEEFEEIRSESERFVVAPGHVAKFERVVHETARFQVVEKVVSAAEPLAGLPERLAG